MYVDENLELLEKGCANMQHHIRNAVRPELTFPFSGFMGFEC